MDGGAQHDGLPTPRPAGITDPTPTMPIARPEAAMAGSGAMRRYLLSLLAGGLLALTLMVGTLAVLAERGALPPPQLSNSLCMDEKLAFMRENPPEDPNLLVVGSSVAWRHFNSAAAIEADPSLRPYNAGLCGASVAQTEQVVGWLMGRLPSVERVVLIASPMDFGGCAGPQPSSFDVADADRLVFEGASPLRFYARYFDPVTFARNAWNIGAERSDPTSFQSLATTQFGDGPIEPADARGLLYGAVTLDQACFAALRRTAETLESRGVTFDVAPTPLHPEWRRRFDEGGRTTGPLAAGIAEALAGTGALLLPVDPGLDEGAFFDAIHIRWSRTPEFTRALLDEIRRAP